MCAARRGCDGRIPGGATRCDAHPPHRDSTNRRILDRGFTAVHQRVEEPPVLGLPLQVPGLLLDKGGVVGRFVRVFRGGGDLVDLVAPTLLQVVEGRPAAGVLVRDLLDVLDRVQLVPALVAGVVDPAAADQDEVVRLEVAPAVEVTVVVRSQRPGGGDDRGQCRGERDA